MSVTIRSIHDPQLHKWDVLKYTSYSRAFPYNSILNTRSRLSWALDLHESLNNRPVMVPAGGAVECVCVCMGTRARHGYKSFFSLCSLLCCCLLTARGPDFSKAPASTEETPAALSARYCPLTHCRSHHAKQHKHRFHSADWTNTKRMGLLFAESYCSCRALKHQADCQPSHAIGGTHESCISLVGPFQHPLCTNLDIGILSDADRRKSFLIGHSAEQISLGNVIKTSKQHSHTQFNFNSFVFWFLGFYVDPYNWWMGLTFRKDSKLLLAQIVPYCVNPRTRSNLVIGRSAITISLEEYKGEDDGDNGGTFTLITSVPLKSQHPFFYFSFMLVLYCTFSFLSSMLALELYTLQLYPSFCQFSVVCQH